MLGFCGKIEEVSKTVKLLNCQIDMKICLINNLYPPYARGGAEEVVARTAQGLKNAGHEVVLITGAPCSDEPIVEEGVKIYRLAPYNLYFYPTGAKHGWLARLVWHLIDIFNFVLARKIKKILQVEKPDVVHTHNLMGLSFLVPTVIRKLNLKHVHTLHDVQLIDPSGIIWAKDKNLKSNLTRRVYAQLLSKLSGSPQMVLSSAQAILDLHKRFGFFKNSSCQILRNPVEMEEWTEKKFDNTLHFIFVGQIEPHKGVMMLVEAMTPIGREVPDEQWELVIAGEGSDLLPLKSRVGNSSRIHILGRLNRQEINFYLQKSEILIVPSLCFENTPTVILEGLSSGLVILASDAPGVGELVAPWKNGLIFKSGDIKSLQETITWCFKHKFELKEMSKANWQKASNYNVSIYIKDMLRVYERASK